MQPLYDLDHLQQQKVELEQFCLRQKQQPLRAWPKALEQQFWQQHTRNTRENTSRWFWGGLITYLLFIAFALPEDYAVVKSAVENSAYFWHDFSRSVVCSFNGFFAILLFYIFASRPHLQRYFYVATLFLVGWGLISVSLIMMTAHSPVLRNQSMLLISFIYMLSFSLSGLKPRDMLLLGTFCALVIYSVLQYWQIEIFSMNFRRALLGSCLIGFAISSMLIAKERWVFLQGELMQINEHIQRVYASEFLHLSQQDGLTQISNRRTFDSSLQSFYQQAQQQQENLAVLFIDVDYFKKYNDYYGHQKGDQVISSVANCIKDSIRHKDFVARYGGEEFVVLLPETDANGAYAVANNIYRSIERLQIAHAASLVADRVTISLGITVYAGQSAYSSEQVLNCADQALYRAKQLGRNQIYYQPLQATATQDLAKSGWARCKEGHARVNFAVEYALS